MIRSLAITARPWLVVVAVVVVTLGLDQLSKRAISDWLGRDAERHRWEIAGPFLAFEYVENTGAAFGLLAGRVWLLTLIALVVAALFTYLLRGAKHDRLQGVALGLIVGGAAGNIVDRIRIGHVTDFLAVGIWPKFNLADTAITVGLVLIAGSVLAEEREPDDPEPRKM